MVESHPSLLAGFAVRQRAVFGRAVLGLAVVGLALPLSACLWDHDTLEQERSRFPSALELITGKFLRHSDAFYQWRIEDRREKLKDSSPESQRQWPEYYDDIAVALDKLGRPDEAIEQMRRKEEVAPGQYETLANLGTFHIHAGRLEEGRKYIAQAIELNPDAHFGREEYQLLLVDYLLSLQKESANQDQGAAREAASEPVDFPPLPLAGSQPSSMEPRGFAKFIQGQRPDEDVEKLHAEAVKGVLGMMRFGHYDSPILLEALADLLSASYSPQADANLLAARAYLKASYEVEGEAQAAYRRLANDTLKMHEKVELDQLEKEFKAELQDAERWFAELTERETAWIADPDIDPEAKFHELYQEAPLPASMQGGGPRVKTAAEGAADYRTTAGGLWWSRLWQIVAAVLLAAAAAGLWALRPRRSAKPSA